MARVHSHYGQETTALIADDLKDLGFRYATISGLSIGMDDFADLKALQSMVDEGERKPLKLANNMSRLYH